MKMGKENGIAPEMTSYLAVMDKEAGLNHRILLNGAM